MVLTNHGNSLGTLGSDGSALTGAAAAERKDGQASGAAGVRQWLGRSLESATEKLGDHYLRRLAGIPGALTDTMARIPLRMHRSAEQSRLVIELLDDVRSGRYRQLHWYSLPLAAAAFLYALSPADVVPDVLPLVGSLDDAVVVALAVRLLRNDLRAYCRYKGYPEDQFFDPPAAVAQA